MNSFDRPQYEIDLEDACARFMALPRELAVEAEQPIAQAKSEEQPVAA